MANPIVPIVSSLLISTVLTGCSTFSSSDSACMKTSLVTSLSKMPLSRAIRGDARTMTLSDFKAGCGGSSNQLPGGSDDIGINVTFMVPAAKHPRHRVNKVTFPLFVALVDKNENVIDRRDESVDIKISDKSLNFAHKIIYTPPKEVAVDSENHRILVGFNESKPPIVSSSEGVKKIAPQKPRKKRIKRVGYLS